MLKSIPNIISPELFKILMEMGHGDDIVLADGNFPAAANTQRLIRSDGHDVSDLLDAILKFFPLDRYIENLAGLMSVVPGDKTKPVICDEYKNIITKYEKDFIGFEFIERFAFCERAKKAFAIIATSEKALYANIIFKKRCNKRLNPLDR